MQSDDGSIIRYGELTTHLKAGDRINQGSLVGLTTIMEHTMLHIEVYSGDWGAALIKNEKGDVDLKYRLSDASAEGNEDVKDRKYHGFYFERREDLVDPSIFGTLSHPIDEQKG